MKIGVCCGIERARIAKDAGFDHIEENMAKLVGLPAREVIALSKEYEKIDIPVYSTNCFFGGGIRLYDDEYTEELRRYGEAAFERAHALGAGICVIGSGGARNIPESIERERAERRFTDVIAMLCDIADGYGIRVAVEPLNSTETNFINKVADSERIAKMSGCKNIGALVDFYHFFMENESEADLLSAGGSLIHTHIARPNPDRLAPRAEDAPTVRRWAELLSRIGYRGAISLEASYVDFESDIRETIKVMEPFRKI